MSAPAPKRSAAGIVGFGVAACAACCAGPVVAFLAAAGLLTAGSVAMFGLAGLLVTIPTAVWFRRRRATQVTCAAPDVVSVELSTRPANTTTDPSRTDGATVTTR